MLLAIICTLNQFICALALRPPHISHESGTSCRRSWLDLLSIITLQNPCIVAPAATDERLVIDMQCILAPFMVAAVSE